MAAGARTVFVTGATGLVGSRLCENLVARGDRVLAHRRGALPPLLEIVLLPLLQHRHRGRGRPGETRPVRDIAGVGQGALGAQGFADDVARFLMPPVLAALQAAAKAKAATPAGGGR